MYGEIGGRILSCPGGGQCYVKGAERVRHITPLLFDPFQLFWSLFPLNPILWLAYDRVTRHLSPGFSVY